MPKQRADGCIVFISCGQRRRHVESNDKTGDDSLWWFAFCKKKRTRGPAKMSQSREHRVSYREASFPKSTEKHLHVVQKNGSNTPITVSACNNHTYEAMESWDGVASVPQRTHNMTPQQRPAQFEHRWYIVQTTASGSNTIPTRTCTCSPRSHGLSFEAAVDRQPSRRSVQKMFLKCPQNSIQDLAIRAGEVQSNTLILSTHRGPFVVSRTPHNRFEISLSRCNFSVRLF